MCPLLKSWKEIVEVFELIPQERVKNCAVKQTDDQNTHNQLQVARQAARRGSEREREKKKERKGRKEGGLASTDQRRICRHSKAGSLYTGPSWKDAATNYSTKAHFQNHVRACSVQVNGRTGALRLLFFQVAGHRGKFVWPISAWTVSFLRVLTPGQHIIFIG